MLRGKLAELRSTQADAGVAEAPQAYHVIFTGAAAKRVRGWLRTIPRETLNSFIVMDQPRAMWHQLADFVHPRPADFALPSFLPWVYADTEAALAAINCPVVARHRVVAAALATQDSAEAALVAGVSFDFSLLRRRLPDVELSDAAQTTLLSSDGATVTQLLWFYRDGLRGATVLRAIAARLAAGEALAMTFGKLVERMLVLQKEAAALQLRGDGGGGDDTSSGDTEGDREEHRTALAEVGEALELVAEAALADVAQTLELPGPVLELGDASYSQVCTHCFTAALQHWSCLTGPVQHGRLDNAQHIRQCVSAPADS